MQDFVAIDFETANGRRSSICSVGIIHEEYRVKDIPLVWLCSDTYPGITDNDRKVIFKLY